MPQNSLNDLVQNAVSDERDRGVSRVLPVVMPKKGQLVLWALCTSSPRRLCCVSNTTADVKRFPSSTESTSPSGLGQTKGISFLACKSTSGKGRTGRRSVLWSTRQVRSPFNGYGKLWIYKDASKIMVKSWLAFFPRLWARQCPIMALGLNLMREEKF